MATKTHQFSMGDVVRLTEFSGTVRQQKLVWRITRKPVKAGKTRALRETYGITPVNGGAEVPAHADQIVLADRATTLAANKVVPAPTLYAGSVVNLSGRVEVRGVDPMTELVVLKVHADATIDMARLGGDEGRYFRKVPVSAVELIPR